MQSITFTPIELLQYGGWTALCLGVTMLVWWAAKKVSAQIAGWTGLVLVIVGCISFPVRYSIEGHIAHEAAFAELPVEWQAFCNGLDGLDSNLHSTAISQFVDTKPPKLTPDHYATVTAMRNLRWSPKIKMMVDFSFVEGKE